MNTITIPTDSVLITTVLDNTDCIDFGHDTPTPVTRLAGVTARTADEVTVDLDELVRRALLDNDNADVHVTDTGAFFALVSYEIVVDEDGKAHDMETMSYFVSGDDMLSPVITA